MSFHVPVVLWALLLTAAYFLVTNVFYKEPVFSLKVFLK